MKICNYHGSGVCVNCNRTVPKGYGEICRYEAEDYLDLLVALTKTKFTNEQRGVITDFMMGGVDRFD